jgi:hypothetical protein
MDLMQGGWMVVGCENDLTYDDGSNDECLVVIVRKPLDPETASRTVGAVLDAVFTARYATAGEIHRGTEQWFTFAAARPAGAINLFQYGPETEG